jgi:lysophospholipase L1-like esterase
VLTGLRDDLPNLTFRACSGAKIEDFYVEQYAGATPPQLDALEEGGTPELVTLTIGGNDAGFVNVIETCVADAILSGERIDPVCKQRLATSLDAAIGRARDRLPDLYREIRERSAANARIIVLGYPQIFPRADRIGRCLAVLSLSDLNWMHQKIRDMNQVIRQAVDRSGVRAEYVDVFDRFAGHDVCNDGSWFNGPMLPKVYMLHPTAEGQAAMARAVAEQLERTPPGAGFSGP